MNWLLEKTKVKSWVRPWDSHSVTHLEQQLELPSATSEHATEKWSGRWWVTMSETRSGNLCNVQNSDLGKPRQREAQSSPRPHNWEDQQRRYICTQSCSVLDKRGRTHPSNPRDWENCNLAGREFPGRERLVLWSVPKWACLKGLR